VWAIFFEGQAGKLFCIWDLAYCKHNKKNDTCPKGGSIHDHAHIPTSNGVSKSSASGIGWVTNASLNTLTDSKSKHNGIDANAAVTERAIPV
jgi:hypothetical protein